MTSAKLFFGQAILRRQNYYAGRSIRRYYTAPASLGCRRSGGARSADARELLRTSAQGSRLYEERARSGTLQTTALANEVWLRLVNVSTVDWKDRAHFFAIAAQMMRRFLVDAARARGREKRGGSLQRVDFDEIPEISSGRDPELLAIDDALRVLAQLDRRKARVIELRFFGGLSVEETAEILQVHEQTVLRDWRLARVWMLREISGRY